MSLYGLVDKSLTKAFKAVKDLAVTATFVRKTSSTFDFSKGQTKTTMGETIEAKVVIVDNTNGAKDRNVQQLQIMFKVADVGDLILYETVIIDGVSWKLGKYIKTDRFINMIEQFKEN